MGLGNLLSNLGHFTFPPGLDGQLRVRIPSQIGDHHAGPFGGQFTCHRIADTGALAGSGHHGGFPGKHFSHVPSLSSAMML
jgi:hypothetical protein